MNLKLYLIIILSLIFSSVTFGAMDFEDAVFPELVTSSRALAMGNAYLCRVDDSAAAFYNPAGLGSVRISHFHLTNVHLETNKGLIDTTTGGTLTSAASNLSKAYDLDGSRQLLKESRGKIFHNRVQTMPNIITRYMTMGYFLSQQSRSTIPFDDQVTDASGAQFEYAFRRDHGPYWALNLSLFGGVLKFGGTGILLNRIEATGDADPNVSFELQDGDYYKGTAFVVEGGARLTLPIALLPTFSAVYHNALGSTFSGRAKGAPPKIKSTMDIGFSVTPQIGKFVRVHLEVNYKDATGLHADVNATRKVLAGMEIDFARVMFVRLGYGDGFGSGGIGIKTRRLEFDLTTYAVDTTTSGFRGQEDRRFVISLSSGF